MDRRAYLRAVAGASTVAIGGCLGVSGTDAEFDIGMATKAFEPQRFTAEVGETVVWRNTSSHAHTVTAYEDTLPEGAAFFSSGEFEDERSAREAWSGDTGGSLYQGDTYSHTFEVAGEYSYFCIPHERGGMVGTIVVE